MNDAFRWCLHQKDGLKKIKPNVKLCNEYMEKAREDLTVSKLLLENKHYQWFIIVNYYAMYHSATALLALVGWKSKNHTCTRIALEELFTKKNRESTELTELLHESYTIKSELIKAFSQAKKLREEVQYDIKDILRPLAIAEREKSENFIREINFLINSIKEKINE